jgi:hypothetical protein
VTGFDEPPRHRTQGEHRCLPGQEESATLHFTAFPTDGASSPANHASSRRRPVLPRVMSSRRRHASPRIAFSWLPASLSPRTSSSAPSPRGAHQSSFTSGIRPRRTWDSRSTASMPPIVYEGIHNDRSPTRTPHFDWTADSAANGQQRSFHW